jgi:hypothetical protein
LRQDKSSRWSSAAVGVTEAAVEAAERVHWMTAQGRLSLQAAVEEAAVKVRPAAQAPVATVSALRETSVLFGALLGVFLLKEAFTLRRAVATCAIVAGAMALRLA